MWDVCVAFTSLRFAAAAVFNYLQQSSINMPTCIMTGMYMSVCVCGIHIFDMIRIFVALSASNVNAAYALFSALLFTLSLARSLLPF